MNSNFKRVLTKSLLVGILPILAILAGSFFLRSDIEARGESIAELRGSSNYRTEALDALIALRAESQRVVLYRQALEKAFPTAEDLFVFRTEVRGFASQASVTLDFKFGNTKPGTGASPSSVGVQMTVGGSEQGFLAFLGALEGSSYFIRIDDFDISYASGGSRVSATLKGQVFVR